MTVDRRFPHRMTARRRASAGLTLAAAVLLPIALSRAGEDEASQRIGHRPEVEIAAAARAIDALIEQDLRRAQIRSNDAIDDQAFVRRAWVAIAGRIPTRAEYDQFLANPAPTRRALLIDRLLDSKGHQSRMFQFFADLLRVREKLAGNNFISGEPYIHFLKQALADNVHWDDLVFELLTAEGPAHARDHGATGYLLRDLGMPEDNMANSVRTFLGTRLECAQCHNHPFDRWTQREFFQMAAFAGGLDYKQDDLRDAAIGTSLLRLRQELIEGADKASARGLKRALRPIVAGISGSGTGLTQLPKDYAYDDAAPLAWVPAATLFGDAVDLRVDTPHSTKPPRKQRARPGRRGRPGDPAAIASRAAFAEWVTAEANPRFAIVIANRLWKLAMGRGLVEPVDNWTDDTAASNPELLAQLERLMVDLDFDLREFLRVLYNTATWQRAASAAEVPDEEIYRFPGPLLQRMSAEQLWDSLLTLTLPDVDATLLDPNTRAEPVYRAYEAFLNQSDQELHALVEREALRYRDPKAYKKQVVKDKLQRQGFVQEVKQKLRELGKAKRHGRQDDVLRLRGELVAMGIDPDHPGRGRKRSETALVRASELAQPAPDDHLLRQFGQSDREQIEASHTAASVPQALALINGYLEEHVLHDDAAAVLRLVLDAHDDRERVRRAFLSVLAREPTAAELALWQQDLAHFGSDGVRDLLWTLCNTQEFRYIR